MQVESSGRRADYSGCPLSLKSLWATNSCVLMGLKKVSRLECRIVCLRPAFVAGEFTCCFRGYFSSVVVVATGTVGILNFRMTPVMTPRT